jgi:hypothetical protein
MAAERTPDEILTIRERLREIEFHAKSSDDFLQGLVADPEGVLRRYGIDDAVDRCRRVRGRSVWRMVRRNHLYIHGLLFLHRRSADTRATRIGQSLNSDCC